MPPRFSVIMPLYNHEDFVAEAIDSVLGQSLADLELIIIDDGSSDGSAGQVRHHPDARLRFIQQPNQGAHVALNRGIGLAQGEFLAVINSDDRFHPDRLAIALDRLSRDQADAFFSGYDFMDQDSAITRQASDILAQVAIPDWDAPAEPGGLTPGERWTLALLAGNFLHSTSNLVLRRALWPAIGPFRDLRYVHDFDFFLRLCQRARIAFDRRALFSYRFHGSNTLAENGRASVLETVRVLWDFLSQWRPAGPLSDRVAGEIFSQLLTQLRTYGGDRPLLALALADRLLPGQPLDALLDQPQVKAGIRAALEAGMDAYRIQGELDWERAASRRWWETSQALRQELDESQGKLAWQEQQTHHWWQQCQEANSQSQRLASELEQAQVKLQVSGTQVQNLTAALAAQRRYCGLAGVASQCKARLMHLIQPPRK